MTQNGLMPPPPKKRLHLSGVTLCAVSSVNVLATLKAIETCLEYARFADVILITDTAPPIPENDYDPPIRLVEIEELTSGQAYSHFILERLVDHVASEHCLLVQWDGHIIDPERWRPEFLNYDYIGSSWPQFDDSHNVGNGGFSLRSRRLMKLCRQPEFKAHHPEDLAVCRTNRAFLESRGMRFAPAALADAFAAERAGNPAQSFGYHGVFLMPRVLGPDRFWQVYLTLDARTSLWRDLGAITKALRSGENSILRSLHLFFRRLSDSASRLF